jgi:hypothetical protein
MFHPDPWKNAKATDSNRRPPAFKLFLPSLGLMVANQRWEFLPVAYKKFPYFYFNISSLVNTLLFFPPDWTPNKYCR